MSYPGLLVIVAAYGATAGGLYDGSYPNLWGVVAAAGAAVAWYSTPLGRREARLRHDSRALNRGPSPASEPGHTPDD
jgi:hypothetical protein